MNIAPALRLGHATPVRALARAPHARLLASGDDLGRVLLWDLDSDEPPRVIRQASVPRVRSWLAGQLGPSSDGVDDLVFLAGGALVAAAYSTQVVVHDVATGALAATFRRCASPLAADGPALYARQGRSMVRLDPRTGGRTHRVPLRGCPRFPYTLTLDLAHRRAGLAEGNRVLVWDLDTGRRSHLLPIPDAESVRGYVAFAPDGRRVAASAEGRIYVVDLVSGEVQVQEWPLVQNLDWSEGSLVVTDLGGLHVLGRTARRVASERVFACLPEPDLHWADARGGICSARGKLGGADAAVVDLSFDGPYLHSAHADGVVRTWGVRRRTLLSCHRSPWGHPQALDGAHVVSTRALQPMKEQHPSCAWIWSARTGKVLQRVEIDPLPLLTAALAGDTLVVRSGWPRKRTVHVHDLATGTRRALPDIVAFGLSADGRTLALSGARSLDLLDLPSGRRERLCEQEGANVAWRLTFSPDGRRLAAAGEGAWFHVWDLDEPRGAQRHALDGPLVALSDEGRLAAFSPYWARPCLYDGHRWRALPPHGGNGRAVAFGPGGLVATGATDGSVHVHGRTGRLLVAFQVLPPGEEWLSHDGRKILRGSPGHRRYLS